MNKKRSDSIPQGIRFDVFRRDGFTCRYCGRSSPMVILHCDHVKPRSKGGETSMENLVTACTECNGGKRAKTDVEPPRVDGLVGLYGCMYDEDDLICDRFTVIRACGSDKSLD